jgi:plasmid maintenance system antidote protein VapI
MGWRVIKQPDGKYARFSDVVDNFTDFNLSREGAIRLCMRDYQLTPDIAAKIVRSADDHPGRWQEAQATIEALAEAYRQLAAERKTEGADHG